MKAVNHIIWIIGAAAVVLAGLGLFYVMGEMGKNLYTYKFDTESLVFIETGGTIKTGICLLPITAVAAEEDRL